MLAALERCVMPKAIVVMGPSGCGKSTLAHELARCVGYEFIEGDRFHAPENLRRMSMGTPLEDEDRWPWLERVASALGRAATNGGGVAACSALKRSYRDLIRSRAGCEVIFVLIDLEPSELARRLKARAGHFMPASLLESQLAALEQPSADEAALRLDGTHTPELLLQEALRQLIHHANQSGRF